MRILLKAIYRTIEVGRKGFNKVILVPGLKASLGSCGKDVRIAYNCDIKPARNIFIEHHSQIGPHALFWTTRAQIRIGSYVLIGPRVTIITGDHRTDIVGRHIIEVSDDEKLPEHDADVVIKNGVWIGSNVTILKGVTIGEGCIIASGSIVTKSTEPYGVYAGVPARKIKNRFIEEELKKHLGIMISRVSGDE